MSVCVRVSPDFTLTTHAHIHTHSPVGRAQCTVSVCECVCDCSSSSVEERQIRSGRRGFLLQHFYAQLSPPTRLSPSPPPGSSAPPLSSSQLPGSLTNRLLAGFLFWSGGSPVTGGCLLSLPETDGRRRRRAAGGAVTSLWTC